MDKHQIARVIAKLSDKQYVIELQDHDEVTKVDQVCVVHDYVEFTNSISILTKGTLMVNNSNYLTIFNRMCFQIYAFKKVILPYLNSHPYLQDDHALVKRKRDDGTEYYNYNFGTTEVIKFHEHKEGWKYAVKMQDESEFTIVTPEFYKKFVEPNLEY